MGTKKAYSSSRYQNRVVLWDRETNGGDDGGGGGGLSCPEVQYTYQSNTDVIYWVVGHHRTTSHHSMVRTAWDITVGYTLTKEAN